MLVTTREKGAKHFVVGRGDKVVVREAHLRRVYDKEVINPRQLFSLHACPCPLQPLICSSIDLTYYYFIFRAIDGLL